MKNYSVFFLRQDSIRKCVLTGSCLAAMIVTLLAPQHLRGQLLQGNITGNVTDTSQAAVAGATVRATSEASNFTRETQTNATGGYTLTTLPPERIRSW